MPDHEAGFAAFLLNRCSRSGMIAPTVGPIGGWTQGGRDTIAARFNGPMLAERIRAVAALGERFRPRRGDGIAHVEDLAGSGIEDEVFLFVDPPYIGPGDRLYAHGMSAAEHARLARALRSCPASWVLTYDAHPQVEVLYQGHEVQEFEIGYSAAGARTATEYLVTPRGMGVPSGNPLGRGGVWPVL